MTGRQHATEAAMKTLPQSIPFGWYFVHYGDELAAGEVKRIHYFDRELVLFRTQSGRAVVMDAYCPHLGAHLGVGGKVEGDLVRCPFHAWAFDADGLCRDIPYAQRMPSRVRDEPCIFSYPVQEKNQVIWAWYHPQRNPPFFDVAENPEVGSPEWTPLEKYCWELNTNPQEIAENGVDVAHFKYVHGMNEVPEGASEYDAHRRRSWAEGRHEIQFPDGSMGDIVSRVETVQNGAGQKWTRFSGTAESLLQVLVTPVDAQRVELRFAFTHPNVPEDCLEYVMARRQLESLIGLSGVAGDIPIWHHKIHRQSPILCDGDGPIMRFRRYFAQFYCRADEHARNQ